MSETVKLYGEVGYHNVSIRAVCAAAQLTERYFHESFISSGYETSLDEVAETALRLYALMPDH